MVGRRGQLRSHAPGVHAVMCMPRVCSLRAQSTWRCSMLNMVMVFVSISIRVESMSSYFHPFMRYCESAVIRLSNLAKQKLVSIPEKGKCWAVAEGRRALKTSRGKSDTDVCKHVADSGTHFILCLAFLTRQTRTCEKQNHKRHRVDNKRTHSLTPSHRRKEGRNHLTEFPSAALSLAARAPCLLCV